MLEAQKRRSDVGSHQPVRAQSRWPSGVQRGVSREVGLKSTRINADPTLGMDAGEHAPQLSKLDLPVASLVLLSHELRTPLTPILGYLEALLAGEAGQLTVAQRDYLGIVLRNAKRLARVADEIAFVAKEDDDAPAGPS